MANIVKIVIAAAIALVVLVIETSDNPSIIRACARFAQDAL